MANVSVASPNGMCTLMTFSCQVGPTSSYAARRPSIVDAQVMVDMDSDLSFMGCGHTFDRGGMVLVPRSGEDGSEVGGCRASFESLSLP